MKPSCARLGLDERCRLGQAEPFVGGLTLVSPPGFKIGLEACMITIGKLAVLAEVSTDTLRYYEREGLIEPTGNSAGGYRLYDKEAARRIRFIKQAQHCGFTLAEIGELLVLRRREAACCGDIRKRAIEKKLQIEGKIRSMKSMSKALDRLIAECANETNPIEECTILAALEHAPGET